jgi:hypothetical protein
MDKRIELKPEEDAKLKELQKLVAETRNSLKNHEAWGEEQIIRNREMAKLAHELHMELKNRGIEPKHHKYMLENRGVPVEDIEFYNHIHPVEDLIAFIEDPDANADPEDSTIGEKFRFKIYTRRWGHYDTYTLKRTENGWEFESVQVSNSGKCDKSGTPYVFNALDHDLVSYPKNIGELLEWVWVKASEGLNKDEVQIAIDDIAEWISMCERSVPRGIFEELL